MIPGRWEKVEALTLGPQITVELKNGARLEGQFEELSPSELLLRTGSAQAGDPTSGHRADHHSPTRQLEEWHPDRNRNWSRNWIRELSCPGRLGRRSFWRISIGFFSFLGQAREPWLA